MSLSSPVIEVRAPSRLHFGLLSFGDPTSRCQFGGVGMMLRSPGIHARLTPAADFLATGKHADRAAEFARRVCEHHGWDLPAAHLDILSAPRQHVGLGVGTQLGMTVAAALHAAHCDSPPDAGKLAKAAGRGLRSSIGSHGFLQGGLIVDSGHREPGVLGTIQARCEIPSDWRVVLAIDTQHQGLALSAEKAAFEGVPPAPKETTARLQELALAEIVPALDQGRFDCFSQAVYEYGVLAGQCFARVQGGPFASSAIAARIDLIRTLGCTGCGQSSWGPAIFALTQSESDAEDLLSALRVSPLAQTCELLISEPANTGARIRAGRTR